MINWNIVLRYIKNNISLPSSFIEKNDNEIKQYIIDATLPEFSDYFPDTETTYVDITDPKYKTSKLGHYKFFDEEELPIISVIDCYFSSSNSAFTGHPLFEPTSYSDLNKWSLEIFKSKQFAKFTMFNYTHKFIQPNIIRILPAECSESFVVEYEREQPHDLRKIPNSMRRIFLDLCLADIMEWIARIRKQYSSMQTPFGEIPLNADELKSDAQELKMKTIEKLTEETLPPIIIDIE